MIKLAGALVLGLMLAPAVGRAADASALWKIVSGRCVPHEQSLSDPAPCAIVDIEHGFAVLKDINGIAQFLLIPTARVGGIEDPLILAPDAVNYWQAAWTARYLLDQRLHAALPRNAISLAINSYFGRTQDQLHIHIDCVRRDVREVLAANLDKVLDVWSPYPVSLAGHNYRSVRIDHETLDGIDPFRILADNVPPAQGEMGMHTLVVVGAVFAGNRPGFVLLDDHADVMAGDRASGEQLQDHGCAVAADK